MKLFLILPAALSLALTQAAQSSTDGVQDDFYAGKTITLQIGSSAGSGYDTVGRLLIRHLVNHIPGRPNFIVQNVPGTGSLPLANEFYNLTPRDGTVIGLVNNGVPTTPLLVPDSVQFDPREFNFLGSTDTEQQVFVVRSDASVQSWDEVYETEVIVGAGAPGASSLDLPILTNALLDTNIRIVRGYAGAPETALAVQAGEVEGIAAVNWTYAAQVFASDLETGAVKVIAQYGATPHPDLPDIPLVPMGDSEEDRMIFELMLARQEYGRPFITPPGVPEERLAILRDAFEATLADEAFLAEAAAAHITLNPVSWQSMQELTDRIYETPAEVLDHLTLLLEEAYR